MKVLHFVTGGFSVATQVAIDLCLAAQHSGNMQVLLVLRRKRNTDASRVQALRDQGLDVRIVAGWAHWATIVALYTLLRQYRPNILVAHGFSEHLWGRYAGLLAKVPHLVHVEHNSRERYTWWRLWQAKWLARRTAAIVGVSEGVRSRLIELGFPVEKCVAIPNGVHWAQFEQLTLPKWPARDHQLLMTARFARQKDQRTLIQAIGILKERNVKVHLALAGSGKTRLIRQCKRASVQAGLTDQIEFLGQVIDMPQLLLKHQIFILSTHYEGMPLALIEAMACGCACIGSDVIGVREVIEHDKTGLLVPEEDAPALADAIEKLLSSPALAEKLGQAARQQVHRAFDMQLMHSRYADLFFSMDSCNEGSTTSVQKTYEN